jgi:hypothetical protein
MPLAAGLQWEKPRWFRCETKVTASFSPMRHIETLYSRRARQQPSHRHAPVQPAAELDTRRPWTMAVHAAQRQTGADWLRRAGRSPSALGAGPVVSTSVTDAKPSAKYLAEGINCQLGKSWC